MHMIYSLENTPVIVRKKGSYCTSQGNTNKISVDVIHICIRLLNILQTVLSEKIEKVGKSSQFWVFTMTGTGRNCIHVKSCYPSKTEFFGYF